ncbi:uncharacterized protein [Diadema antillarum]|uniref:uncharacterized protein n=1 Tax=Diadema antillarum TaxID=105358 RepID=UPI003A838D5A
MAVHLVVVGTNTGIFESLHQACQIKKEGEISAVCAAIYQRMPAETGTDVKELPIKWGPISQMEKDRLFDKLRERSSVFCLADQDYGLTNMIEHRIRLTDETPFQEQSRRVSPSDLADLRAHLQELLQAGIITDSKSPYVSLNVLIRKKKRTVPPWLHRILPEIREGVFQDCPPAS